MTRFSGKNVLITGGTSGIGLATARRIAQEGGRVAVTGRSQHHLDEAKAALPDGALVLQNDAADPDAAKALAEAVKGEMGGLDGLFLNAGFGKFMATPDIDADAYGQMFDVNVRGVMLHTASLAPILNDGAAILITSSVSPYLGQAGGAIYGGTKGAVTAMAKSFAREFAGRGIRSNSIAPGPIETNFAEGMDMSEEEISNFFEQIKQMVPLGRMGKSEEVAALACFLLSDEASYITGSEIMVDGGMTMR